MALVNDTSSSLAPTPGAGGAYHRPVLLTEALEALAIKEDGIYVDCTYGGGGHSRAILERLGPKGRLIAFDHDPDAKANVADDPRLLFVPESFSAAADFLKLYKVGKADGLLADLGVSSHQFDRPERGFSIRFDGPADMRMDTRRPKTAAHIVHAYSAEELQKIFEQYGEVTNAKTLAKRIVDMRGQVPMETVHQLKSVLMGVVMGEPHKYFAQVFQALRIEVNGELEALKRLLGQLPRIMATGGRAVFITFHSLEEKLVKNYFRTGEDPSGMVDTESGRKLWKMEVKKTITASPLELKENTRSRSAKLRWAELA